MLRTHILGYPIIGKNRELKFSIEDYMLKRNEKSLKELRSTVKNIIRYNIKIQNLNLDINTIGCFRYPDPLTYSRIVLGLIDRNYISNKSIFDTIFNITMGNRKVRPFKMMKWFGTNFHYFNRKVNKKNYNNKISLNFINYEIGITKFLCKEKIKCKILGPFTLCKLMHIKSKKEIKFIIYKYNKFIKKILDNGIYIFQLEEPSFDDSISKSDILINNYIYSRIDKKAKIIFTNYFSEIKENIKYINTYGIHIDLIRNYGTINLNLFKKYKFLSIGLFSGENVFICDIKSKLNLIKKFSFHPNLLISNNCSMKHIPYDSSIEKKGSTFPNSFLSFYIQKIREISITKEIYNKNNNMLNKYIKNIICYNKYKKTSLLLDFKKESYVSLIRKKVSYINMGFDLLPFTTIGSFPQTKRIRSLRNQLKNGNIGFNFYRKELSILINNCVLTQRNIGVDLITNGEVERNDMVQYFCEFIEGCYITNNGWVQSYCTRCVKPPILWGNMNFINFRKEFYFYKKIKDLNSLKVKYIVTGPVTIFKWSFVREDLPLERFIYSLAYSISKLVNYAFSIGIFFIQIDEPAIREFIEKFKYLDSKKIIRKSFEICYSGVINKNVQIHTHVCYSRLTKNELLLFKNIGVDKVSIESSENLNEVVRFVKKYSLTKYVEIGFGIYNVHSNLIPSVKSIVSKIRFIIKELGSKNIWINPDCGLKTRKESEVYKSLLNIKHAISVIRKEIKGSQNP
ncbi:hypothetical protein ACWNYH_00190 [Candidatus Vidania fulgoroideorum]